MKKYLKNLFFIEYSYPFIQFFCLFILLVESFSYIGFVRKFIFFDSLFFFFLLVLFNVIFLFYLLQKKDNKVIIHTEVFLQLISLTLPVVLASYYFLKILELRNYPNYVFSHFHLDIGVFENFVVANTIIVFSSFIFQKLKYIRKIYFIKNSSIFNFYLLKTMFIFIFLTRNLIQIFPLIILNISQIINNPFANYDEKMTYNWGFFYEYMKFIQSETPEDSTVAIPPAQSHWLSSGNSVLVRYFLFPRRVVNLKETESYDVLYQLPEENLDFVLLSQGEWVDKTISYGWPKKELDIEYISGFNKETKEKFRATEVKYNPLKYENTPYWGVIKLRNEDQPL